MNEIVNRVAKSDLITINLEDFYTPGNRDIIDIKEFLWQGIALREKDFRDFINTMDWQKYKDKFVSVHCSVNAVVPIWAYMLIGSSLQPYAKRIFYGNEETMESNLFLESLKQINPEAYKDARVVIKGCGKKQIPESVYLQLTAILRPYVKSIMFGEPCSTVPIYKR